MSNQIMIRFAITPKKLFLIDSLGALLTAFLLFFVLKRFDDYFGMPKHILNYLSVIAFAFFLYSFTCHIFLKRNWKTFLKIIITANLLYTFLTFSLVIYHLKILTLLGIIYFILEIIIVLVLVSFEIRTLRAKTEGKFDGKSSY